LSRWCLGGYCWVFKRWAIVLHPSLKVVTSFVFLWALVGWHVCQMWVHGRWCPRAWTTRCHFEMQSFGMHNIGTCEMHEICGRHFKYFWQMQHEMCVAILYN
jgi:hypothetical protein